jgi:hypothetical protein
MKLVKISKNEFLNVESVVSIEVFRHTNKKVKEIAVVTLKGLFVVRGEYIDNFIKSLLEIDKNSELHNFLGEK